MAISVNTFLIRQFMRSFRYFICGPEIVVKIVPLLCAMIAYEAYHSFRIVWNEKLQNIIYDDTIKCRAGS